MWHGFQKKIDGFLSNTKSDSTEKIRSGLSSQNTSETAAKELLAPKTPLK